MFVSANKSQFSTSISLGFYVITVDTVAPVELAIEQHRRVGRSLLSGEDVDADAGEDVSEGSGEGSGVDMVWDKEGRLSYNDVIARAEYTCVSEGGAWQDYYVKGKTGGCTEAEAVVGNGTVGACDHWDAELSSYPDSLAVFKCDEMRKYGWLPLTIGVIYTFWVRRFPRNTCTRTVPSALAFFEFGAQKFHRAILCQAHFRVHGTRSTCARSAVQPLPP